jgi:hypothetical protein
MIARKPLPESILACLLAAVALAAADAAEPTRVAPGTPVTITVTQAKPESPPVSISLRDRAARATPVLSGCTHTGGGTIDVQQPSPDVIVVTMGAVAVAYPGPKAAVASMHFDLEQCFEVSFDSPKVKRAKITLEARIIGLLRSHCKGGAAEFTDACATIGGREAAAVTLAMPPRGVANGDNLSVNDRALSEPATINAAGRLTLHQTFVVTASAPKSVWPYKAPSAEFAPDPALDPLWISYKEPFHGAVKKDYGFQVTVRVADDTPSEPEEKKNGDGAAEKKKEEKKNGGGEEKKKEGPAPEKKDGAARLPMLPDLKPAPTKNTVPTTPPKYLPAAADGPAWKR